MKIEFTVDTERIRHLGAKKGNVAAMSTNEAEAFMTLFHGDIEDSLRDALKTFVDQKIKPAISR